MKHATFNVLIIFIAAFIVLVTVAISKERNWYSHGHFLPVERIEIMLLKDSLEELLGCLNRCSYFS